MQKKLAIITLTVLFTLMIAGSASAATYSSDTSLTLSHNSANPGDQITLTADVNVRRHGTSTWNNAPAGLTVTFSEVGGSLIGAGITDSNGIATCNNPYTATSNVDIRATFAQQSTATDTYHSSSDTDDLDVYDTSTSLTVTPTTTGVGNSVTLRSRLTNDDVWGNPGINGQTIHFFVDDVEVGSDTTDWYQAGPNWYDWQMGWASITYTPSTPGIKNIQARYNGRLYSDLFGNYDYLKSSTSNVQTLTVTAPTSLTVNPASGYKDHPTTLSATLTSGGNGLAGQCVNFFINGNPVGSGTTDSNGMATFDYTILQGVGSYPGYITACFDGTTIYLPSNGANDLTVNAIPTSLTVDSASGYKDDDTVLSATLWDTAHNGAIVGKYVDFYINNVFQGSGLTDTNGVATWTYNIAEDVGVYPDLITAIFSADTQYASSNGANTLTVNAIPTSLTLDPASGYKGDNTALTARLWDTAHNIAIAGKPVAFYVDGVLQGSSLTDSNGYASWIYNIVQDVGTYPGLITAFFTADGKYAVSNGVNTLTVNAIPTSLVVNDITGNKGKTVTLKATLTDNLSNTGIEGKTILFKVNGVHAGSATTDATGVATIPYLIELVGGNYDITAEFAADDKYACASGTGKLKVPQSSIYVLTTVSKKNPNVGETIKITFKLGNKGPDAADNVVFTYVIPEGLEFVSLETEPGYPAAVYDPATRTVTWTLGTVPVLDPWLNVNVKVLKAGSFVINPSVTTDTYDTALPASVQSATINAVKVVNAATEDTVGMQESGIPLSMLVLAILAVLGGFIAPKRK